MDLDQIVEEEIELELSKREARGQKRGLEKGIEKSILLVLQARGLPVSDAERERVEACTDLPLAERWLQRAAVARSTAEIFREE